VGLAALRIATGLEKNIGSQVGIAAKEMREAHYWLSLIGHSGWFRDDVSKVIREAAELVAILGASARTARKSQSER
jgi:hypothetical protein